MGPNSLFRDLHRIHVQLRDLNERLERGPRQVKAHESNVARCEAELAQVRADTKAARVSTDQKQLLLKSAEVKIADLRNKLNQASSNREYQALLDQIAADEMASSVLADEILEALEKLDEFETRIAEAVQVVARAKEELAKVQHQVRDQQGLIEGDLRRLQSELQSAEHQLPADVRDVYQRMVKSKGSEAMAVVEGENCSGCHQTLTPNLLNSLLMDKIVVCQSCGRLLYLPEDRTPGRGR